MEDNKELALESAENVEQATEELVDGAKVEEPTIEPETTEQVEKTYTKAELTEKIDSAVRRREAKLRREYEEKYGDLENVLKAGTGKDDINDITNTFTDFYTKKGINIPQRNYNENDLRILANAEADEIIDSSFDEVVSEVDRLADKGIDNMTSREKIVFQKLATYRQSKERENELASIGAMKVVDDKEFNDFASQFNSDVPMKKVYEMWTKVRPQPEVEQMGSMKNTTPIKTKEYYTPEEARRLTSKQLDDPAVMKAVEDSMKIWYEKGI